jgi:hypothetical protein
VCLRIFIKFSSVSWAFLIISSKVGWTLSWRSIPGEQCACGVVPFPLATRHS